MMLGRPLAIVAALLISVQIVRAATVAALAPMKPYSAAQVWSGHPTVNIARGMTDIAVAARARKPVPTYAYALMARAAAQEPLAPEPFLVAGVQAQMTGNMRVAQKDFEAAQWRDPRSLPAAYFLADRYLRVGDVEGGLREAAILARLSPNGATLVGPYIGAYAADARNWPKLRLLLRDNPDLADVVLNNLASRPETAAAALALADPQTNMSKIDWFRRLLDTLTAAGEYGKARTIWSRATGFPASELLHDPSFSDKTGPMPFNWDLTSSAAGLAERQPRGRLHILFYGQEDGILARQLLLLPSGSYRLEMRLLGDASRARNLTWSLWCDKTPSAFASITLDRAAQGWVFKVPANCPAQWLQLSGSSGDISQQIDVTISDLRLRKAGPDA